MNSMAMIGGGYGKRKKRTVEASNVFKDPDIPDKFHVQQMADTLPTHLDNSSFEDAVDRLMDQCADVCAERLKK